MANFIYSDAGLIKGIDKCIEKIHTKRFFHKFEKYATPWRENTSIIVYFYDLVVNQF